MEDTLKQIPSGDKPLKREGPAPWEGEKGTARGFRDLDPVVAEEFGVWWLTAQEQSPLGIGGELPSRRGGCGGSLMLFREENCSSSLLVSICLSI